MRISELITQSADVVTIASGAPVSDLLELLGQHNIGCVVVADESGHLDGIVSERDIVRHLTSQDITGRQVSSIMVTNVVTCHPSDDVESMARRMTEERIRHVPVVDDGRLVGIISIGDIVKHRLDQLEAERDHLMDYVQQT